MVGARHLLRLPRLPSPHPGVHEGHQFLQAGYQSHLLGFARGPLSRVKGAPPPQQGPQLLGFGLRQGPGRQCDGPCTVRTATCGHPVGFGQAPHRLGQGSDVAGIDDRHRAGGRPQSHDTLGAPYYR